jgi:hypothetical protein
MRQQDLDAYARVLLDRVQRAVEANGGIATVTQMERMRECYTQLHRDTKRLCAQRRKAI